MRKLNVTQAGAVSLLVAIVGQAVAVIPSLKAEQAAIISTGTLVIAAVFVVVHAVHAVIDLVRGFLENRQQVTLAQLEEGVKALARDEVGKALGSVDLNATAKAAIDGQDIAALVRAEAQKVFAPFAGVLGSGNVTAGSGTATVTTTNPPAEPLPGGPVA